MLKIGEQDQEFGVLVCQDCWDELWGKAKARSHDADNSAVIDVESWSERVSREFWGNIKQIVLDMFREEPWSYAEPPFYTWSWVE